MAALVCDICGGKLIMGTGGIAVCDSCGMEHSADRMKEKVQEIKGTVRVDNSHMIDNWMKMGTSAAQAGNQKEAYEYFTKVIEVDPENWRALYEKGKAGAWQSTLANLRISEMYQGVKMALEIIENSDMTDEDRIGIKNEFAVALFNINNAITDLMEENLNNLDDKYFDSHWDQMWETRQRYITNVSQLEDALSLISDLDDELSKSNVVEFKKRMCSDLRNVCNSIQYWTDYSESSLGYLGYTPNEKKPYLDKYWKLVAEIREVEPQYATEKWSYPDPFEPGLHMSDECYRYWEKIDEERQAQKEKETLKKRFDSYWAEHADEKAALETEKATLEEQISALKEEMSTILGSAEQENIQGHINALNAEKSALGLFKGREKKTVQEKIDVANTELKKVVDRMDAAKKEIEKKIDPLQRRISEINSELTKAR